MTGKPKVAPLPTHNGMGRGLGSRNMQPMPPQGWNITLTDKAAPANVVIVRAKKDKAKLEESGKRIDAAIPDSFIQRHHENMRFYKSLMKDDPKAAGEFAESLKDPFEGLTDRQRRLARLRFRGLSWPAAAKTLGIDDQTAWREAKVIKAHYENAGLSLDQNLLVGESMSIFEEVSTQAWNLALNSETSPGEKVKALQLILQAKEKQTKLLLDIGVLQKATTKHEHVLSVSPWVEKLQRTDRTAMTHQLLESQLSVLDEPVPLEDGDVELAFAEAMVGDDEDEEEEE